MPYIFSGASRREDVGSGGMPGDDADGKGPDGMECGRK